ncbi:hypothetical protein JKP88DRAFT_248679 [Tribonema minus]|uniref:Uncharacterized protein n=1 Tax=Tribonema minus TaxID=303371 RepID=A0A836CAW4_9STRA|nr:hypothetical protein JKP88DRAFT_248679 [Tribonema minus]
MAEIGAHAALGAVLRRVRRLVREKRIPLETFFTPFDQHHSRKITKKQFVRALSGTGAALTEADTALLCDVYGLQQHGMSDLVLYRDFCEAVMQDNFKINAAAAVMLPNDCEPPVVFGVANPALSAHERALLVEALHEMRRAAREKGLVVKNLYLDFDPLRSGCVSGDQLMRVIGAYALLCGQKLVDVAQLVRALRRHVDRGRQSDEGNGSGLSPLEAQQVQNLLEDMARQVAREGLLLKPAFAGFDRCHEACIAKEQFLRVLDSLKLVNVDSSAAHALCRRYSARDVHHRATKHQSFVRYLAFVNDVLALMRHDATPRAAASAAAAAATQQQRSAGGACDGKVSGCGGGAGASGSSCGDDATVPRRRAPRDAAALLRALREERATRPCAAAELLRDFDPLRHGTVTRAQFSRALRAASGIELSDAEVTALCRRYAAAGGAAAGGAAAAGPQLDVLERIVYRPFLADVDCAVAVPELENFCARTAPTPRRFSLHHAPTCAHTHAFDSSVSSPPSAAVTAAAAAAAAAAVQMRVAAFLRDAALRRVQRGFDIARALRDLDPRGSGTVTDAQLQRALSAEGAATDTATLHALCAKFRHESEDSGLVAYRALLSAAEEAASRGPLATPRRAPGVAEYRALVQAQRATVPTAPAAQQHGAGARAPPAAADAAAVRAALLAVRRHALRLRCDLRALLSAEDPAGRGEITVSALRHRLALAGIALDARSLRALEASYRGTKFGDHLNWRALCADVAAAREDTSTTASTSAITAAAAAVTGACCLPTIAAAAAPFAGLPGAAAAAAAVADGGAARGKVATPRSWGQQRLALKLRQALHSQDGAPLSELVRTCTRHDRGEVGLVSESAFFEALAATAGAGASAVRLGAPERDALADLLVVRKPGELLGVVDYRRFVAGMA